MKYKYKLITGGLCDAYNFLYPLYKKKQIKVVSVKMEDSSQNFYMDYEIKSNVILDNLPKEVGNISITPI